MKHRTAKHPLILYVTPLILCVVACTQRYLSYAYGLDSWKGGGFGMFATLQAVNNRHVSATLVTAGGREVHISPANLRRIVPRLVSADAQAGADESISNPPTINEIITLPTDERVEQFARLLLEQEWAAPEGPRSAPRPLSRAELSEKNSPLRLDVQSVRVDVWKYVFDSSQSEFQRTRMRSVAVPAAVAQ